jgi:hypothetical protein
MGVLSSTAFQNSWSTAAPCGSELAREGVGSVKNELYDATLSRASSLPQGVCLRR